MIYHFFITRNSAINFYGNLGLKDMRVSLPKWLMEMVKLESKWFSSLIYYGHVDPRD